MKSLNIIFLVILFTSCEQNECCNPDAPQDLLGDWLLSERGYSPGAGYIVDQVSPVPPQTITLEADGQFESNISDLVDFEYFQVLSDPNSDDEILALFMDVPEDNINIDELAHSYNIVFEDGIMKLYFRFCFEGCHLGFGKVGF